ncbi:unnamed protein product [Sphagnum balticum]
MSSCGSRCLLDAFLQLAHVCRRLATIHLQLAKFVFAPRMPTDLFGHPAPTVRAVSSRGRRLAHSPRYAPGHPVTTRSTFTANSVTHRRPSRVRSTATGSWTRRAPSPTALTKQTSRDAFLFLSPVMYFFQTHPPGAHSETVSVILRPFGLPNKVQ